MNRILIVNEKLILYKNQKNHLIKFYKKTTL